MNNQEYNFPKDLYVRVEAVAEGSVKAEIYRRVESEDAEVVHMKRAGLIWLKNLNQSDLEHLAKRLKDESSWDAHK